MRTLIQAPRRDSGGFTLIECLITVTILAVVFTSAISIGNSGRRAFEQNNSASQLDAVARRTLDRVAAELTPAVRTSLAPNAQGPLGASTLAFRVSQGVSAGVLQTSSLTQLRWQQDPDDPDDGIDNDGDGGVDEGEIVLTHNLGDADEISTVIARDVAEYLEGETPNLADDNGNGLSDERGFSISADADGNLTIRISFFTMDPDRRVTWRTVETGVHMRN